MSKKFTKVIIVVSVIIFYSLISVAVLATSPSEEEKVAAEIYANESTSIPSNDYTINTIDTDGTSTIENVVSEKEEDTLNTSNMTMIISTASIIFVIVVIFLIVLSKKRNKK
ncbi:MAG: hypothetical protein IJ809_05965 [Clostridia bacterium]|nr:hypothetical protein [Clostridia bacterium]